LLFSYKQTNIFSTFFVSDRLYLFYIANEQYPLFDELDSDIFWDNSIDITKTDDDGINTNDAITIPELIDTDSLDRFSYFIGVEFISMKSFFSLEYTDHDDSLMFLFLEHNNTTNHH